MKHINRALLAIGQAIKAIDVVLTKADAPNTGPASMDQLQMFRNELSLMIRNLEGQQLLQEGEALRRIGPIIIDSWPLDSELGAVLLRAENEYVKCWTARNRQTIGKNPDVGDRA